jgi:hypothetical protein
MNENVAAVTAKRAIRGLFMLEFSSCPVKRAAIVTRRYRDTVRNSANTVLRLTYNLPSPGCRFTAQ